MAEEYMTFRVLIGAFQTRQQRYVYASLALIGWKTNVWIYACSPQKSGAE
jgi:hypothetical protein